MHLDSLSVTVFCNTLRILKGLYANLLTDRETPMYTSIQYSVAPSTNTYMEW